MQKKIENPEEGDLNRRSFIKGGSMATFVALMGGIPLRPTDSAAENAKAAPADNQTQSTTAPPIKFGVIGCGPRGRELLKTLAIMPNAPVVAICDTYEPMLKRSKESAPKAQAYTDYKQLLQNQDVQAVIVTTPTHRHKDIIIAALNVGKHVYCEMPLAHTVEEARAIALAAQGAFKVNFQAGLENRSDPLRLYVLKFVREGDTGKMVMVRAQWHKKQSLRRASATAEREKELNWRLCKESTAGLIGELGIVPLDNVNWYLHAQPTAVTGFGGVLLHADGREVPDTVQAVFEYPNDVQFLFDLTLANSFESDCEVYCGSDGAIMFRDVHAWLFKESDAPQRGWEVYALKEALYKEAGIVLRADASDLVKRQALLANKPPEPNETALYKALEAFITNSGLHKAAVEDYIGNFGENDKGLRDYLPEALKGRLHAAGYQEGFEATVTAIKANEAVLARQRVIFKPEWFDLKARQSS